MSEVDHLFELVLDLNMDTPILIAAVTACSVVASAVLSNAITFIKDRNADARRLARIDYATKSVAFWDQWLELQRKISPEDKESVITVCANLKLLSSQMDGRTYSGATVAIFESVHNPYTLAFRKTFALFRATSVWGVVLQLAYWAHLIVGLIAFADSNEIIHLDKTPTSMIRAMFVLGASMIYRKLFFMHFAKSKSYADRSDEVSPQKQRAIVPESGLEKEALLPSEDI